MKTNVKLYGPTGHLVEAAGRPDEIATLAQALTVRATFKAAEENRLNANWTGATNEAINTVLARQLRRLRGRARWLEMNNPYMQSAVNTILNYCVGTGFQLQMLVAKGVKTADGYELEEMEGYNDFVEDLFDQWSEDVCSNATATSPESFGEQQDLACRRMVVDGEFLVYAPVDRTRDIVPLALRGFDANQFDTSRTEYNGNPVFLGVEIDRRTRRPLAYWVYDSADEDPQWPIPTRSIRLPADRCIHIFRRWYPDQLRGIPSVCGVAQKLFDIDQYENAQIVRGKVAALFGVLLEGGQSSNLSFADGSAGVAKDSNGFPTDANGNVIANLAPGIVGSLPEGVKPHVVSPTAPESAYEPFMRRSIQAVGAGFDVGLSYTGLTRDTSATTFAGGRQAENMDVQGFRRFMRMFSRRYCSGIFRLWHQAAVMSGAVTAPGYDSYPGEKFWQRHAWMPSGWSRGINPVQEATASRISMEDGITTLADECAWIGRDWKVQLRNAAKIRRFKQRLGLPVDGAKPAPAAQPNDEKDPQSADAEAAQQGA